MPDTTQSLWPEPDDHELPSSDEGGLHAPPDLYGWRKAWWWFDFVVLVNLARLRFIAILVVIGVVIMKWDTLAAYYNKMTRSAESAEKASSDVEYFCPMHPSVIRDNPKEKCPVCFMPLSKRKKGESDADPLPAGVVNRVQLSPYRVVLAGVETWPVGYIPLTKEITAVGYVEFNERGQRTVTARVAGRIDKLFVNETGQMVKAGDELASIYSPDLLVTVQNMLDAKRNGNQDLINSARTRLQLLGVDDAQIDDILSSGKSNTHVRIRSPISGHVIKKYVREGQYVQEGTPLYDIVDLATVWIQAQVYEDDLAFLPAGYEHGSRQPGSQGVEVTATARSVPDQVFQGRLAFIYPHVDQETRTVTVRFELDNPGHKLRPGSTATVTLKMMPKDIPALTSKITDPKQKAMLAEGRVLAVPESSVIDTGSQRIVYRESTPGVFEGIEVVLGPRMTDVKGITFFPVVRGLESGERIVTSGSFLVDAETRLNPAAGSIYFGGSGGSQGGTPNVKTVRPTTPSDVDATIQAELAKLSPEDHRLATAQKSCPVLGGPLGAMGKPVKIMLEGQPVFLCCKGCIKPAESDPKATLAKVEKLKQGKPAEAKPANDSIPPPLADKTPAPPPDEAQADPKEEADIREALAKLSPADRKIAEAQRFCAVLTDNRLGSMDKPVKVMIDGQPVFLCCDGCKKDALADKQKTFSTAKRLRETHGTVAPK